MGAERGKLVRETFTVLTMVKEGKTQAQIAKEFEVRPAAVSKRFKRLERKGLIEKIGRDAFNLWRVTLAGKEVLKSGEVSFGMETRIGFRWHNLLFKVPLLGGRPLEEDLLREGWVNSARGAVRGWGTSWDTVAGSQKVFLTGNSLLLFMRVEAGSIGGALELALRVQESLCERFRELFPGVKLLSRWELCRQHFAWKGGFTDWIPKGFVYAGERLVIDFSTGKAEVETIDKTFAVADMARLSACLEDQARGGWEDLKKRVLALEGRVPVVEFDRRDRI